MKSLLQSVERWIDVIVFVWLGIVMGNVVVQMGWYLLFKQ